MIYLLLIVALFLGFVIGFYTAMRAHVSLELSDDWHDYKCYGEKND